GLMITEYLSFPESDEVQDVVANLRTHADEYAAYDVQYVYTVDDQHRLTGVVPMRRLLLRQPDRSLADVMAPDPVHVSVDVPLDELETLFDSHRFFAVPVVDRDGHLVGVVRRAAVEEAHSEASDRAIMRLGGIIGGEEFRSMPVLSRTSRRLAFLTPNIFLNLIAVSVIAYYEPTLAQVTALMIFLPILSDMSGCSGNQAVAVSLRELSLGMARPRDIFRVIGKEAVVGAINGLALGLLLGIIAVVMKGNIWLGGIVAVAMATNSVIAVCLGGTLPLALRGLKIDPALAAGPLLTTVTDMAGFFIALTLTALALAAGLLVVAT
ncbi:MAG: magnesium transporter, partial [Phycisphaeraceae bacterium]|nr:magnesium transporter [Phycisphaeraceae bacterium]